MAYPIEVIEENAKRIRHEISEAAIKSGRKPEDVLFCAACKTQTSELIRKTADFPFDIFGENRAQELKENYSRDAYGGKDVHFIGHLQTNKVKDVVGRCSLIQSVDSIKLMEEINKQALKLNIVQDILIEINLAQEESKSGIRREELEEILASAGCFSGIFVKGLMGIPPKEASNCKNNTFFETLYSIFVDIKTKKYDNVTMCCISMGMSADFYPAILCGANIVRIGSSLFGPRI